MKYWRMQLHPDNARLSAFYAHQSIARGVIGLDFREKLGKVGDLSLSESRKNILPEQKIYTQFADDMDKGDRVLIIAHHFPLAVVTVDSEYRYTQEPDGVWFKHFREIDKEKTIYYADFKTNAKNWESCKMTNVISQLKDKNSQSYKLIEKMLEFNK